VKGETRAGGGAIAAAAAAGAAAAEEEKRKVNVNGVTAKWNGKKEKT